MGPKPLGNISKMPMKKCSFSSHPIKTVFGKSFILPLEKKKKAGEGEKSQFFMEEIVMTGEKEIEKRKLGLPKQEGQEEIRR